MCEGYNKFLPLPKIGMRSDVHRAQQSPYPHYMNQELFILPPILYPNPIPHQIKNFSKKMETKSIMNHMLEKLLI